MADKKLPRINIARVSLRRSKHLAYIKLTLLNHLFFKQLLKYLITLMMSIFSKRLCPFGMLFKSIYLYFGSYSIFLRGVE